MLKYHGIETQSLFLHANHFDLTKYKITQKRIGKTFFKINFCHHKMYDFPVFMSK